MSGFKTFFKNLLESKEAKEKRLELERRMLRVEQDEGFEFPVIMDRNAHGHAAAEAAEAAAAAFALAAAQKQKLLEDATRIGIEHEKIIMIMNYLTEHGFTEEEANAKIIELLAYVSPREFINSIYKELNELNMAEGVASSSSSQGIQIDQNVQSEAMELEKKALSIFFTYTCKKTEYLTRFDTLTREEREPLYNEIIGLGVKAYQTYALAKTKYEAANDSSKAKRVENLNYYVDNEVYGKPLLYWGGATTPEEIAQAEASIAAINARITAGLRPANLVRGNSAAAGTAHADDGFFSRFVPKKKKLLKIALALQSEYDAAISEYQTKFTKNGFYLTQELWDRRPSTKSLLNAFTAAAEAYNEDGDEKKAAELRKIASELYQNDRWEVENGYIPPPPPAADAGGKKSKSKSRKSKSKLRKSKSKLRKSKSKLRKLKSKYSRKY